MSMAFSDIDFTAVFRRLADKRIEEAMAEGKFDNLRGAGEPLVLDPMPADEEARATWWAVRIMRNADFTPDEVRWRKMLDHLRDELSQTRSESRARALVGQINDLVGKVNALPATALQAPVSPVDEAAEVERVRRNTDRSS